MGLNNEQNKKEIRDFSQFLNSAFRELGETGIKEMAKNQGFPGISIEVERMSLDEMKRYRMENRIEELKRQLQLQIQKAKEEEEMKQKESYTDDFNPEDLNSKDFDLEPLTIPPVELISHIAPVPGTLPYSYDGYDSVDGSWTNWYEYVYAGVTNVTNYVGGFIY